MTVTKVPDEVWRALKGQLPRDAGVAVLASGWDCDAVLIDGRIVVKLPKHPAAEGRLRREAAILALLRSRVTLPVPDLHLVEGACLVSWHPMLVGGPLLAAQYDALGVEARDRLAGKLGQFMAQVHGIGLAEARAAGAVDLGPWDMGDCVGLLPHGLRAVASGVLRDFAALPPDPLGQVFGQFDGHGWNMAFDGQQQELTGVFDFGDAGIGDRHQDLIYAGLTSLDLMGRVVRAYEAASGVMVDRERLAVVAGAHRLWELAESRGSADCVDAFAQWGDWPAGVLDQF